MRSMFMIALLAALVVPPVSSAGEPAVLDGEALVRALRAGGHNLYFRHAATDWSQDDDVRAHGDWTSCDPSRVRQLSDTGRRDARAAGAAIRALRVPVGPVLASPYCRTVETAALLGLGPVETTTDVMNLRAASWFGGRDAIVATARARLATPPPARTNAVIVAHGNVVREATGVYPGEGEAAVFRPDGAGGFAYVGSLSPAEWSELARARKVDRSGGGAGG